MANDIFVQVRFDDLPDTATVTGQATMSNGCDARFESNGVMVVYEFRRETVGSVRQRIQGRRYDAINLTDIVFKTE